MSAQPIEWVLVVFYGKAAHGATYGRLSGTTYSKDYIQLSRKPEFIADLESAFPDLANDASSTPIRFLWPTGSAEGTLFRRSADRPHLAWETNRAPAAWKMSLNPTETSAETIPGDPARTTEEDADREYDQLVSSEFGQPYLIAVKLRGEQGNLHLRVHIENPNEQLEWADLNKAPQEIQELAASTAQHSALAWKSFSIKDGVPNLFFDPSKKVDPWGEKDTESAGQQEDSTSPSESTASRAPSDLDRDSWAEGLAVSEKEVAHFEQLLGLEDYGVSDSLATVRTRGSAQKVFADSVKKNYQWRCALTGIKTREFLVASHIVPWSVDETIRLDPSNGICLSVLVDRAFENGFLVIGDDLAITINWDRVGDDVSLKDQLSEYDGIKLSEPTKHPPKVAYLRRRREL